MLPDYASEALNTCNGFRARYKTPQVACTKCEAAHDGHCVVIDAKADYVRETGVSTADACADFNEYEIRKYSCYCYAHYCPHKGCRYHRK